MEANLELFGTQEHLSNMEAVWHEWREEKVAKGCKRAWEVVVQFVWWIIPKE